MIELPFRFPWRVFLRLTAAGIAATVLAWLLEMVQMYFVDVPLRLPLLDLRIDLTFYAPWHHLVLPVAILVLCLWLSLGRTRGVLALAYFVLLANTIMHLWPATSLARTLASRFLMAQEYHPYVGGIFFWGVPGIIIASAALLLPLILMRPHPGWPWLLGGWLWALAVTVGLAYTIVALVLPTGLFSNLGPYLSFTGVPIYLAGLPWLIAEARGDDWRQVRRPPPAVDCASNES